MSFWCLVKDDKNLIKRIFVQLHFGRASGPGISLASSSPWPHWPWMPQVAWRSHQHLPGHWPRMCEKFCEMVTPWLPINFKKAKWEGLIFKGFSMIFLWGSIATWYIQFTHIYHPYPHNISWRVLCARIRCMSWELMSTIADHPTGSNRPTYPTYPTYPTWHRTLSKVLFSLSRL